MKRTPLNKIGKIGRANIEARKIIAEISENLALTYCEIRHADCLSGFALAPAHRHKRSWYNGNVELLADPKQWVCACQNCHNEIENDPELTEEVFMELRGNE